MKTNVPKCVVMYGSCVCYGGGVWDEDEVSTCSHGGDILIKSILAPGSENGSMVAGQHEGRTMPPRRCHHPDRGHEHTQTRASQPQAQRDWNGTAMGWRCFCTCELEVITCSTVAVGLVVITFIHQVPVGSGRSSCRCCNKIRGLGSLTWARAHSALARESADAFAETSNSGVRSTACLSFGS